MEPAWLQVVSWVALAVGFGSALAILTDELVLGNRQHMAVMNLVHPITPLYLGPASLYLGPAWLWAYVRHGRKSARPLMHDEALGLSREGIDAARLGEAGRSTKPPQLQTWHVADAVSHCGAGCTLGDIGGEWILFAIFSAPAIGAAGTYGWEIVADFALAWTLGIAFQYFTIAPMHDGVGPAARIAQAIEVDTLSILAFQLGLFGWMALAHFVLFQPALAIDTNGHWFMMQIGMTAGFLTAWPVNRSLIRRGIKEKMDRRVHLAEMVERTSEGQARRSA